MFSVKKKLLPAAGVIVSALTIALVAAPAAQAHITQEAPPPVAAKGTNDRFLKLWTPEWMARRGTPYTSVELTDMARRFHYIASMPNKFKPHVSAMKAANPDLKFVVYKNATFGSGTAFPAELYARNASGGKVNAKDWPTTYVMQLADTRWTQEVVTKCELLARASLYDGCFLDVLGYGPLIAPAYLLSKPVHANGSPWTPREWIGWTTRIADSVGANPGVVTGNGLGEGKRYFDATAPTSVLADSLDGAMAEVFIRGPQDSITRFRSEADWLADVRMLADVEARGSKTMTTTKIWTAATSAQVNQWHRYTVASFLLGTNGASMMCFLRDKSTTSTMMEHAYNKVDVGTPGGAFAKVDGLYQRFFTGGRVLVNPTSAPVTVAIGGTFTNFDGAAVSGSVTIPAHDAQVLTAR